MNDETPALGSGERSLDDVMAECIAAEEAGRALDRAALAARYPQHAAELQEFFANRDRMQRLAGPLRGGNGQAHAGTRLRYFGDYELLDEIAVGGMGIVYKARQVSLNRIVAVKMILKGTLASEDDVKRFRAEAEAAANLQHPGIVAIHEVGLHEGQHYFSMDFVDGASLAQLPREQPLPASQAAEYVRDAAEAVHYAHQQGTLHRDLKPSNILIDRQGRVRITDFGLAKQITGNSDLTLTGQILGTPSYMPPEQALSKRSLIGTASDVYSLGAVLYELLVGRPPFRGESPAETLRQVESLDPISPRLLSPTTPRDLETICLKCLEKEPHKRYATAEQLADDLGRYLRHEPILARPIGRLGRTWRWCRRNPVVAGLGTIVAATVVLFMMTLAVSHAWVSSALSERTQALGERTMALENLAREQDKTRQALIAKTQALRDRTTALEGLASEEHKTRAALAAQTAALQDLERSSVKLQETLDREQQESYFNSILLAGRECQAGHFENADRQLAACRPDLRSWEWHYIARLCRPAAPLAVLQHGGAVGGIKINLEPAGIRLSADGSRIAVAHPDGVLVLNAAGRELFRTEGVKHAIQAVAISPNAQRLAALGGRCLTVWDTNPVAVRIAGLDLSKHSKDYNCVEFSSDGTRIIASSQQARVATREESLRRWSIQGATILNAESGQILATRGSGTAYSSDGRRFAAWRERQGSVQQIDGGLTTALNSHAAVIAGGAFSPDGTRIATFDTASNIVVSDSDTGAVASSWSLAPEGLEQIRFSADGSQLATLSFLSTLKIWDVASGHLLATLRESSIERLATPGTPSTTAFGPLTVHQGFLFSPDGTQLASASGLHKLTVWNLATGRETALSTREPLRFVAFHGGDNHRLLYATHSDANGELLLREWNTLGKDESRVLYRPGSFYHTVAVNSAGTRIASIVSPRRGGPTTIKIWNANSGDEEWSIPWERSGNLYEVAFSPDDALLAIAGDGGVDVLNLASKEIRNVIGKGTGRCTRVAFCHGGEHLLVAHSGASLFELQSGKEITRFRLPGWCAAAVLTSNEAQLATTGSHGTICIWNSATGEKFLDLSLNEQDAHIYSASFSPDSNRIAAADSNGRLFVWDARSGKRLLEVKGHVGRVYCVTFSRDGKRLVSMGDDGVLRIWESKSGREVLTLHGHADRVYNATFTPDGTRIVSTSADGTIRIWDATPL